MSDPHGKKPESNKHGGGGHETLNIGLEGAAAKSLENILGIGAAVGAGAIAYSMAPHLERLLGVAWDAAEPAMRAIGNGLSRGLAYLLRFLG